MDQHRSNKSVTPAKAPKHPATRSNTAPANTGLHGKALALTFTGLMLAMFVSSLSETIAATALPTIVGDLGGVEIMQWVTTTYVLASTITMPLYGKLGDLIGRKGLLMTALGLYTLGKVICGISLNMEMLITGRMISGIGGGGLIILSQATLADVIPPRKLGTYMGVMGAVFSVSSVLGPLLGGWFVQVTGWRWIFWFTVPLALIAIGVLGAFLPKEHTAQKRPSIDWLGMVTITLFVISLTLCISWGGTVYAWNSPEIGVLLIVFVAATIGFIECEKHAKEPIIPLYLFKNRNFVLCSVVGFLIEIGFMGTMNYLPTYFQIVDRMSPEDSGLACVPLSFGVVIMSTITGWLASKTGHYKWMPIAMCALAGIGFFLMSTMQIGQALWIPLLYLFILGVGFGTGLQILVLVVQNEFSHSLVGTATAANNFFRQIGSTVGAALVGAMFTARLTADLAGQLPKADNLTLSALTPSVVDKLPEHLQTVIANGYSDALVPLFGYFVPLAIAGLILMIFLKQHPLATTIDHKGTGK